MTTIKTITLPLPTNTNVYNIIDNLPKIKKIHMMGICGIGVSSIAMLYSDLGFLVQGSDKDKSYISKNLEKKGINIFSPQSAKNITDDIDLVVISSAIKDDNPELIAAREKGIKIVSRAESLATLKQFYHTTVSVTGTHGKTTTTAMVASALSGSSPTVVNGGIINNAGSNFIPGEKNLMVIESDESDGSFMILGGNINIITNLESDHLDFYGNVNNLFLAFQKFIADSSKKGDFLILYGDDKNISRLAAQFRTENPNDYHEEKFLTYGASENNKIIVQEIITMENGLQFTLKFKDKAAAKYWPQEYTFFIPCYGQHNVFNATAAIVSALVYGFSPSEIADNLRLFSGVKRRFTMLGKTSQGAIVFDDYAHHPTEIKAVMDIAKTWRVQQKKSSKIILIIQPHRFSRFSALFDDFVHSIITSSADIVVVLPIFSAGENPGDFILKGQVMGDKNASLSLVDVLNSTLRQEQQRKVLFVEEYNFLDKIKEIAQEDDILLCTGAGDITDYAKQLVYASSFDSI